mmetsp:Transcript_19897/g.25624  ORF Transcript_19897/g.25624 Transcript_19897/m.25624 type:complete len:120 (+) Transcript_19897:134-493(+)
MVQGGVKLAKAKKSGGAQRRQVSRKKALNKGQKTFKAKGLASDIRLRDEHDTTKAINRKNESLVAAKAVKTGTNFFLTDMTERGSKQMKKEISDRNKKQNKHKASKLTDRLQDQLKKVT